MTRKLHLAMAFFLTGTLAFAFNGQVVTEGPLRLEIAELERVSEYHQPYEVKVALVNSGTAPLEVGLQLHGLVDEWQAVGAVEKRVSVPADGKQNVTFQITAKGGAYSALYPVHIKASFSHEGKDHTAAAVRVFETQFALPPNSSQPELPVIPVPERGAVLLTSVKDYRAGWAYFDQPEILMPIGWQGSAQPSRASFDIRSIERGAARTSLNMHPAWWQGKGTVLVDYRLKLPAAAPITLTFGNAIRDSAPDEPPSDGVTFQVFVDEQRVFNRHTDSKTWLDGQVDLSNFAGQEIRLRLECHPGPRQDTTCDSAYWGDPVIISGPPPVQLTAEQRERLRERARRLVLSGQMEAAGEWVGPLANGLRAAIVLGPNGLADGVIGLGKGKAVVVLDGLNVAVLQHRLGAWPSSITVADVKMERASNGGLNIVHHCRQGAKQFELTAKLSVEKSGLRMEVDCPERITDLSVAPFDQKAKRVYYGHGYCIVEPEAFRAGYGGHNLSTSHVGFDFGNGVSLLTACDNPPDYLEVNPREQIYALHTHMNGALTLVPGVAGIVDCAKKYREMDARKPSPGFARKAGRFVFDVWGGKYAENARIMQRMIDYGLTDSLLTLHVWQRWGYDYRLPDIYPPNPSQGTAEEMRELGALCDAAGIPWGLHDNYIDFYPDADDYSYDHICFTEAGDPIKAWINTGRDAQSYRFRPDHILPFVKRNLRLISPNLKPSHYFIDVFTSINMFDYYDRHGQFHSSLETRHHWGEAFRWIQDYLGPGAITTSEAGDDQLTGYLDGADCQHMNLSPDGGYFQHRVRCQDWERYPWFDLVLHDRFSLHGVGYPGRYEGGRSRLYHGIESDDYLSDELLLGHALMIDRSSMRRGAVRKYWLAQDFIRSLATDQIVDVQFADGDIHRIIVSWKSGARVYVNRGSSDWAVAGKVLPEYGYSAVSADIESSIERVDGVIVERSSSARQLYVNARGYNPAETLLITPQAKELKYLGGSRFALPISWEARQAAPKDLVVFLHFKSPRSPRYDQIAFQGDYRPSPGSSTWQGTVVTGGEHVIEIPDEFGAGEYEIHLGLYDPSTGARYALEAEETGHRYYVMGKLIAEGVGKNITHIKMVPHKFKSPPEPRWNVAQKPVTLGPITTSGAIRCELKPDRIVVTPLPDEPAVEVVLDAAAITGNADVKIAEIQAVDSRGASVRKVTASISGSIVKFELAQGEFAYEITLAD